MRKTVQRLVMRSIAATAAGIAAEVMKSVVKPARAKGRAVAKQAPEAEEWMAAVTHRAMEWMRDSDAPDAVRKFCSKVLNASEPKGARSVTSKLLEIAKERATGARSRSKHS
jgi:hypothetical protein